MDLKRQGSRVKSQGAGGKGQGTGNEGQGTIIFKKLDYIEKALTAKGHPMQDYSTMKMAIVDLVGVIRTLIDEKEKKNA